MDKYYIDFGKHYLDLFRDLIQDRLGVYISREKDYLLKSKLTTLMKKSHFENIGDFYNSLKSGNLESLETLIAHITTTHTYFFRERMHLKILRNDILIKKTKTPKIWCAASSTGEEVYSIIIELLEHNITDFFMVASDINKKVLTHLKKGIYRKDRVENLEPHILKKYFQKGINKYDGYYKVKPFLKKYFVVKKLNLIENLIFEKKFDYIFCRNVLIYFDKPTQQFVVKNLLNNLDSLGYLFVGHSENLFGICDKVESVFTSVYSKKD